MKNYFFTFIFINLFTIFCTTNTEASTPVDIVFAIDTSGSMSQEVIDFNDNINSVNSTLTASSLDVRIIVIADTDVCIQPPLGSGSCASDENLPDYRHVTTSVGSTDALSQILATHPQWSSSLRTNAIKQLVVLSDDDSSLLSTAFNTSIISLDASFQGYNFYGLINTTACPGTIGSEYVSLAASTGGATFDLCDNTLAIDLQSNLTAAIIANVPSDSDNDGLLDSIEDSNGNGIVDPGETDPDNPDTDNDGLLDGEEDANANGAVDTGETDPLDPDSDNDLLDDGTEDSNNNGIVDAGETDPLNPDSDNDGLIDGIEDDNANGVVDVGETDPINPDSDADGVLDGTEDANANGIVDAGESDPLDTDSDDDGLLDGYEVNVLSSDPTSHTTVYLTPGDMNQDGNINAGDITLLIQQVLSP